MFPVHQAPKSYSDIPGDKVDADCIEKEHSSKQIKSDSITCHFRKFIYSYFVRVDELTEKVALSAQRLLLVSRNIVSHANHHSSSEASEEIHADILTTTLQECYVRDHAAANTILKEIFGEGSFDNIFGSTKIRSQLLVEPGASHPPVSQESGDTITSLCFQHSEQALLKSIFVNKIPFKEFLIEYLFKKLISKQLAELKIEIIGTSSEDSFETTALEGLASLDDDAIDGSTTSIPKPLEADAEKLNVTDSSGVEEKPVTPKSLVFTLNHPINLEIISPRHICKFCRGSLHLRCQQVQQILEEGIVVEPIKDKMLTSSYRDFPKIIPKESQDQIMGQDEKGELNKKPSLETHRRLYDFCKVHRGENRAFSEFMSRYQRYCLYDILSKKHSEAILGDGKLNIRFRNLELVVYATSFRQAEDYLMGIPPLSKK